MKGPADRVSSRQRLRRLGSERAHRRARSADPWPRLPRRRTVGRRRDGRNRHDRALDAVGRPDRQRHRLGHHDRLARFGVPAKPGALHRLGRRRVTPARSSRSSDAVTRPTGPGRPPHTRRSRPTAPSRSYGGPITSAVSRSGRSSRARRACERAGASPTVTVTVYRSARATLYGPGFYGKRTACGVKLTRSTIGLANRTLRCGEHVSVYYQGRTLSVPVIDRGPYANGADFDLTMATGRALGIAGTEQIGAVSLPQRARVARLSAAGPPHGPRRRRALAGLGPAAQRRLSPWSAAVNADTLGRGGQPGPARRCRSAPRCLSRPRRARPRRCSPSAAPRARPAPFGPSPPCARPSACAPALLVSRAMIHARAFDSQARMS